MIIPEDEYQKIIKSMPIFCIDFLVKCDNKYLLIKRNQEPMKDFYWVIGGRLRYKETIQQFVKRVQTREIGRYFPNFRLIGFSNYLFPDVIAARATHTPSVLYLVEVDEMFQPDIDDTHCDYIWTTEIPDELKKQTEFFDYE